MTTHPSSQQKRELKYSLLKLQDSSGKYVINALSVNDPLALHALMQFIEQEIAEARADQIMKDFLKHSLCTEVDESLLIDPIETCYRCCAIRNSMYDGKVGI